jgi:hypothetical protein
MNKEHDQSSLNTDIIKGNIDKVLEHLAEARLTPVEMQILMATAVLSRAREKEKQADKIKTIIEGKEEFAGLDLPFRKKAENLRKLAHQIKKL